MEGCKSFLVPFFDREHRTADFTFRICYNECDEAEGAGEGMEKKLFFFDIDGTLTDRSTGQVVPSAKRALELLEEQGHFLDCYGTCAL